MFHLLMKYKADLNVKDPNGWSPLHICAEIGNEEQLNELLKLGMDPNSLCN